MTGRVIYERRDHVAVVTLERPQTHNALTPAMLCALADVFTEIRDDDEIRVAVLTGSGDKAFCAGGDLGSTLPLLTGARSPEDEWDHRVLRDPAVMPAATLREFDIRKPMICAVNGVCLAAGFELMLATDLRLAAPHARFGLPEAQRGLIPFAGTTVRLTRQIPYCAAMQLMLTGDAVPSEQALDWGLINMVVPASELLAIAMQLAQRIARNGPLAVQTIRGTVIQTSGVPLQSAFDIENRAWQTVLSSADAKEGPLAFMEKRPPRFTGR